MNGVYPIGPHVSNPRLALQASDSQEEFLDPGNQLILFDF
jgi:hypothetical protein